MTQVFRNALVHVFSYPKKKEENVGFDVKKNLRSFYSKEQNLIRIEWDCKDTTLF